MSSRWSAGFDEADQERLDGLCQKISSVFKSLEKTLDGVPISKFKKLGSALNGLGNQFYDVQYSTWLELEARYNRLNQIKRGVVNIGANSARQSPDPTVERASSLKNHFAK